MATESTPNSKLSLIAQVTTAITTNRPGWQTTEFYLVAAVIATLILLSLFGAVPQTSAEAVAGIIGIGFTWLRSNRKDDREGSLLNLIDLLHELPNATLPTSTPNNNETTLKVADVPGLSPADSAAPSSAIGGLGGFADLRLLCVLSLFVGVLLVGCAGTKRTVDQHGNPNWNIQGNYAALTIHDRGRGGFDMIATGVDHSTPTLAGGQAFKMNADSVGTTVVSGILSGGLPWANATAAGAQIIPQIMAPAAPVVLQSKH